MNPLMRRARPGIVGCLILLGVILFPAAARAQSGGERIRSYDASITIQRDGSLLVVERIDYDFDGLARHGIFRDIPVRFTYDSRHDRVYAIDIVSVVGSPGTPDQFTVQKSGNLLRIRIGDPDRTITGRHTYTITYRVRGALNGFPDHDELYWNAIGTEWVVPINQAGATVTAPADIQRIACFAGPKGSNLPCSDSSFRGPKATFGESAPGPLKGRLPALDPFEGLTVVVGFPTGVVPTPVPMLVERWSLPRAFSVTPVTAGIGGGLLAVLIAGIVWLLWTRGRDRRAVGSPVDIAYGSQGNGEQAVPLFERGAHPVEFAPPEGLKPGQVGTLLDEVANPLDVTATIVDLAVRGFLRIEEIPKKGRFGKQDWRLVKLREADGLMPYERRLFEGLFTESVVADTDDSPDDLLPPRPDESMGSPDSPGAGGVAAGVRAHPGLASVKLSRLRTHFASRLHRVQVALYEDAVKEGWFNARPDRVRRSWALRGWLLFLAGVALVVLAAWKTHWALILVPLVIAGLLLIWGAHLMPRRTAKGTGLVRRVLSFRTYIETAEKQEARFQERENIFSQYLPYAVVFGCTEKWARAFAHLADQEQFASTGWYVGSRPFTVALLASSIDDFSVTTSGTITSTPAASGSSGFSGGFSGGGGGGGGGGSW